MLLWIRRLPYLVLCWLISCLVFGVMSFPVRFAAAIVWAPLESFVNAVLLIIATIAALAVWIQDTEEHVEQERKGGAQG